MTETHGIVVVIAVPDRQYEAGLRLVNAGNEKRTELVRVNQNSESEMSRHLAGRSSIEEQIGEN